MEFWKALINEICGPWGWVLILSSISCIGFVGMALAHFIKCLNTKNTTSLSKQFVILLPITNTMLTIYDLVLFSLCIVSGPNFYGQAWGMLLPAVINGLISAYGVMILKIKHMRAAKKLGISEMQYYLKYLKPIARSTKKELERKKIHR